MTPTDDRFERIEEKIDTLTKDVGDFRVAVEHRLTKAEERAGVIGAITGLLSSIGLTFLRSKTGA